MSWERVSGVNWKSVGRVVFLLQELSADLLIVVAAYKGKIHFTLTVVTTKPTLFAMMNNVLQKPDAHTWLNLDILTCLQFKLHKLFLFQDPLGKLSCHSTPQSNLQS